MSNANKKLGKLLKLERERQDISLEDLSTRLKISETNLNALEEGKSSNLPAELYFDLFSRSYCQSLGIDHARTLEAINIEIEEEAEAESRAKSRGNDKAKTGDSGQSEESSEDEGASNFKRLGIIFGGIIVLFIGFMLINKFVFDNSSTEVNAEGEKADSAEKTDNIESEIQLADYQWGEVQNDYREPIRLRLTAVDSSWATILADGDTAIFRKLRPGRIYNVEAKYRLQISIGVPRVVKIELNDIRVDLVNPNSRRISRVRINQMNLESFLNIKGVEEEKPEVGSFITPGQKEKLTISELTG